ncbi:MAG: hypothetical protein A2X78_04435 [Gammaproteobacteria bacterium GWE2_37_16]|nr:MAG: hypothetical protein A2X78_04435 [Gammaproteobacteria bacterium GWE2_37_16]
MLQKPNLSLPQFFITNPTANASPEIAVDQSTAVADLAYQELSFIRNFFTIHYHDSNTTEQQVLSDKLTPNLLEKILVSNTSKNNSLFNEVDQAMEFNDISIISANRIFITALLVSVKDWSEDFYNIFSKLLNMLKIQKPEEILLVPNSANGLMEPYYSQNLIAQFSLLNYNYKFFINNTQNEPIEKIDFQTLKQEFPKEFHLSEQDVVAVINAIDRQPTITTIPSFFRSIKNTNQFSHRHHLDSPKLNRKSVKEITNQLQKNAAYTHHRKLSPKTFNQQLQETGKEFKRTRIVSPGK